MAALTARRPPLSHTQPQPSSCAVRRAAARCARFRACAAADADAFAAAGDGVEAEADAVEGEGESAAVRAPLRWIGGAYPALALEFPSLATAAQRARGAGETGIALDFVVDTGSSLNTIAAAVAGELELNAVGVQPAGVSAAGALAGGAVYALGTARLADLPVEERFDFMTGLEAAALPIPTPGAAGVLGGGFLGSFDAVEAVWGAPPAPQQQRGTPSVAAALASKGDTAADYASPEPSWTFYAGGLALPETLAEGLHAVAVSSLENTGLPTVALRCGGNADDANTATVPALLDTGSPITVLNAVAAHALGIETAETRRAKEGSGAKGGGNIFSRALAGARAAMDADPADTMWIAGGPQGRVALRRSADAVKLTLDGADGEPVELGEARVYVGDVPGLAALGDIPGGDGERAPAAVLGVDALRLRPRCVLRPAARQLLV